MGRKRRIHVPGGLCHVTQQCHSKSFDLMDESAKQTYLTLGFEIAQADQVEIISFSIQDSHPHWLLRMPPDETYTLSQFMHKLNTRFGHWFNRTFQRKGSVWADRFSATWVEPGTAHFFEVARYIDRNPLERATNAIPPAEYLWGSYYHLFQTDSLYQVTFLKYLYAAHPGKSEAGAWQWYAAFVQEATLESTVRQSFWRRLGTQLFHGSERFVQQGKACYRSSLENRSVWGLSWIQIVRDYSRLFRPLAELATG